MRKVQVRKRDFMVLLNVFSKRNSPNYELTVNLILTIEEPSKLQSPQHSIWIGLRVSLWILSTSFHKNNFSPTAKLWKNQIRTARDRSSVSIHNYVVFIWFNNLIWGKTRTKNWGEKSSSPVSVRSIVEVCWWPLVPVVNISKNTFETLTAITNKSLTFVFIFTEICLIDETRVHNCNWSRMSLCSTIKNENFLTWRDDLHLPQQICVFDERRKNKPAVIKSAIMSLQIFHH